MSAARESLADSIPHNPTANVCKADQCPMAGSLTGHAAGWWCAYHYRCPTSDIARVTSVLHQHTALRDMICEGRQLTSEQHGDASLFPVHWQRMRTRLADLQYPVPEAVTFPAFLYRLESMMGGYVAEAMRSTKPVRAAA